MTTEYLSPSEEQQLATLAASGDIAARNKLVMSVYRFVYFIACKVKKNHVVDPFELVNIGIMRIIKYLPTFKPEKGRFSTWVSSFVYKEMHRHLRTDYLIRLPGRVPGPRLLDKYNNAKIVISLDSLRKYDDKNDWSGDIEDKKALLPVDCLSKKQRRDAVRVAITRSLPSSRMRKIIRSWMNGNTLEEIGNEYGITKERVRQILEKCICKLKNRLHGVDE